MSNDLNLLTMNDRTTSKMQRMGKVFMRVDREGLLTDSISQSDVVNFDCYESIVGSAQRVVASFNGVPTECITIDDVFYYKKRARSSRMNPVRLRTTTDGFRAVAEHPTGEVPLGVLWTKKHVLPKRHKVVVKKENVEADTEQGKEGRKTPDHKSANDSDIPEKRRRLESPSYKTYMPTEEEAKSGAKPKSATVQVPVATGSVTGTQDTADTEPAPRLKLGRPPHNPQVQIVHPPLESRWTRKKKGPGRKKNPYDRDALQGAYEAALNGASVYKAARLYGVPEQTLRDRVRHRVELDCKPGAPTMFTEEEEKALVEHITYMASIGHEYSIADMRTIATEFAISIGKDLKSKADLSASWFYGFMNRWDKLKSVKPQKLGQPSKETVDKDFVEDNKILQQHDLMNTPHSIWNNDESGVSTEHSPPIVCSKNTKTESVTSPCMTSSSKPSIFPLYAEKISDDQAAPASIYPVANQEPDAEPDAAPDIASDAEPDHTQEAKAQGDLEEEGDKRYPHKSQYQWPEDLSCEVIMSYDGITERKSLIPGLAYVVRCLLKGNYSVLNRDVAASLSLQKLSSNAQETLDEYNHPAKHMPSPSDAGPTQRAPIKYLQDAKSEIFKVLSLLSLSKSRFKQLLEWMKTLKLEEKNKGKFYLSERNVIGNGLNVTYDTNEEAAMKLNQIYKNRAQLIAAQTLHPIDSYPSPHSGSVTVPAQVVTSQPEGPQKQMLLLLPQGGAGGGAGELVNVQPTSMSVAQAASMLNTKDTVRTSQGLVHVRTSTMVVPTTGQTHGPTLVSLSKDSSTKTSSAHSTPGILRSKTRTSGSKTRNSTSPVPMHLFKSSTSEVDSEHLQSYNNSETSENIDTETPQSLFVKQEPVDYTSDTTEDFDKASEKALSPSALFGDTEKCFLDVLKSDAQMPQSSEQNDKPFHVIIKSEPLDDYQ